jgi:chromosome segregation ATPase
MADESFSTPAFYLNDTPTKLDVAPSSPVSASPRRQSFTPGGTTKVLADLQAGILNTKNKLDDTKHQLRQSQRQVSQLTRQTEDLKEARERLRLENEGLNNVVARKERLLQEVRPILFRVVYL